jgi:hypothetical protein
LSGDRFLALQATTVDRRSKGSFKRNVQGFSEYLEEKRDETAVIASIA